jgi:beta-N-acetylhexosaminidase
MAELPLPTVAGQVLVAGFAGHTPPDELVRAARAEHLAGFILFKRNLLGRADEVASLTATLCNALRPERPALLAVDQEGGRVSRLGPPVLQLPPMRTLGRIDDPDLTHRAARHLGRQLRALGFTMDFAPVLDVDTNPDNPVIGDRSFGATPERVIRHGLAFADGLQEAGVLACGKHFPGHGDTHLDSHLALPRLTHDRARLDEVELPPFRACRERVAAIMTAHVVFDALDPDTPATLSRRTVAELLRGELDYDGLVISDDLEMRAVADRMSVAEAAVAAIEAGCDLVLICSRHDACLEAHEALVLRAERDAAFANQLREAALRSIAMRRRSPPAPLIDADALADALAPEATAALEAEIAERTARLDDPEPAP